MEDAIASFEEYKPALRGQDEIGLRTLKTSFAQGE